MRIYILRVNIWDNWENRGISDNPKELEQYVKTHLDELGEYPKDYDGWEDEYETFEDFIWDMLWHHSLDNLNYEVWDLPIEK